MTNASFLMLVFQLSKSVKDVQAWVNLDVLKTFQRAVFPSDVMRQKP